MHFDESAKLARNLVGHGDLVSRCDAMLARLDSKAEIRASQWSTALREDKARVQTVLAAYQDEGLLVGAPAKECACGTANALDRSTCSGCADPLTSANEILLYRFADPSRAARAAEPAKRANPVQPAATERPVARFGIVTALPYEYAAAKVMLETPREWHAPGAGAGRRSVCGEIPCRTGGTHTVVLALLSDPGNNIASNRATLLLEHFPEVEHIIMCGISGGIPRPGTPEHDVRLGDIVVSDRGGVIQYDFGKDDGKWTPRHAPRPPGAALLEAVKYLVAEECLSSRPWETYLPRQVLVEKAQRPRDASNAKGEDVSYPEDPDRRAGFPRVFLAPIASSNILLKNKSERDALAKLFGVKGVEMEGSGIADAAWNRGEGYLVVRGVVDYCDKGKGDHWHRYAAVAAAAYVRALIESMPAGSGA